MKLTTFQSDVGSSGYRQTYYSKIPRGFSQILAPRWFGWTLSGGLGCNPGVRDVGYLRSWNGSNTSDSTGSQAALLNILMMRTMCANLASDEVLSGSGTTGYNTIRSSGS